MPNLLSIERLCIFGLIFEGFAADGVVPHEGLQDGGCNQGSVHPDNEIRAMLRDGSDPRFARIYALSYEGHYTVLPRPTVFLVHGPGADPEQLNLPGGPDFELNDNGVAGETTGLPSKVGVWSQDIRVWVYDRDDMAMRVEIATGAFDELLLQPVFCPGGGGGSRADMTSRADMASRADLTSRADMTSRADLASRADMTLRNRFR